jgi:YtkA-like protein
MEMEMSSITRRVTLALCTGLVSATFAIPAFADVKDFEFQLVQSEVKRGDAVVAVMLVNKRTRQPVPNAVIFAKRIDMAPDGMGEMASPITEVPSDKPGEYRFKTNLSMQGRWQLSLGAKVQGETGSVQSKLVIRAVP